MEKGRTAEVPGLKAGDYQVEFYDTKTGKILEKSVIAAAGETLTLLLPGFSGDLAVKLKPKEKDTLWKSIDFPRPKKSSRTEFLPVSYTHLDVYKRQISNRFGKYFEKYFVINFM